MSNMLYRNIEAYETLGFKVYTSDNAKVLALVDENGEALESWTADESGAEQTAFVIDYFGMKLAAVLTENGFTMNYMDSMLMVFELEE